MRCRFCGEEIGDNAKFCPYCGNEIVPDANDEKTKNMKKVILCGVGVVGAICLVAGVLFAMRPGEKTPSKSSDGGEQVTFEDGDYIYRESDDTLELDTEEATFFYNDMVLVYLEEELSDKEQKHLADLVDGKVVGCVTGATNLLQIQIKSTDLATIREKATLLMGEDKVLYADYDYPTYHTVDYVSRNAHNPWKIEGGEDNPLNHDGDEENPDGNDWWAEAIGAYTAWNLLDNYKGERENVKVGILDGGLRLDHEEFLKEDQTSKIHTLEGYENTENTGEGRYLLIGHGTHVAGIIGAENNDRGIRGIASDADLYFAGPDKDSSKVIFNDVPSRIKVWNMMFDQGVSVFNNSWGDINVTREAFLQYFLEYESHSDDEEYYIYSGLDTFYPKAPKKLKELKKYDKKHHMYEYYLTIKKAEKSRSMKDDLLALSSMVQKNDKIMFVQAAGNGYSAYVNGEFQNNGDALSSVFNGSFAYLTEANYEITQRTMLNGASFPLTYEEFKNHILIVGACERAEDTNTYRLTNFSNFGLAEDGGSVDIVAPGQDIFSSYVNNDGNATYDNSPGTSMAAPMVTASVALLWSICPEKSAAEMKQFLIENAQHAESYWHTGHTVEESTWEADPSAEYPMLNLGECVKKLIPNASEYTIEDYLGFYYEDYLPEEVEEHEQQRDPINANCVSLYFNDDGLLERYSGLKYSTMGTSFYYPYQRYEIIGDELICYYDYVNSAYGIVEDRPAGVHRYIMNPDGTLTADTHILYKVNPQTDKNENTISEDTSPAEALVEFYNNQNWYSDVDMRENPMYELVDIDQDSVPELVIRTGTDMDVSYYVYVCDQKNQMIEYAGSFENGFGSLPALFYSPSFKSLSTYGRTSDTHRDYFYQLKNKKMTQYPLVLGWYDIKGEENFRQFYKEDLETGENIEIASANWGDSDLLKKAEEEYKAYISDLQYISFNGNVAAEDDMEIYSYMDKAVKDTDEDIVSDRDKKDDYVISDSDKKYLSESDLSGLSKDELRLARNEIYARKGRKFDAKDLKDYFNSKSWYKGTVDADYFTDHAEELLNDYEIHNLTVITKYEEKQ